MNSRTLVLLLACGLMSRLFAQNIPSGTDQIIFNEENHSVKFIRLKNTYYIPAHDRLRWLQYDVLGARSNYSFQQVRAVNDELGYTHYRYQQYYKGTKVQWGIYNIHVKDGRVVSANGEFYPEPGAAELDVRPSVDVQDAFQKARGLFRSEEIETKSQENPLRILCRNGAARLCYRYELASYDNPQHEEIYVDAVSGSVLLQINKLHTTDVNGTVTTQYSGTKTITCDNYSGSNTRLSESGRNLYTKNCNNGTSMSSAVDFTNTSSNWTATTVYDKSVFDLHFGLEKSYDYYSTKFSRNSYDASGAQIKGLAHYSSGFANAFWSNPYMVFGDGNTSQYLPFTPVDIVGHEFTHAVTEYEAALVYMNQSGALNESFSDIFGVCIDYYANPTTANFLQGEQCSVSGTPFRNMINPNATSQPDTYMGTYWVAANGPDNGGVHTNSQVQNFWFYLLTNGGSGVNDNSASYVVTGIGIADAEKIAYRNLTVYLGANSTFSDARMYAIQSAIDLFGACSNQVVQCTNAWHAVGVGNTFTNSVLSQFAANATYTCSTPGTFSFTNLSTNGTSYLWNFGDGTTANVQNPVKTYTAAGTYSVKLKTTGTASCNTVDSITKLNYITVTNVGSPTTMCTPSQGLSNNSYGILNVSFAGINHSSSGAGEGYKNLTCSNQATLTAGNPYLLSVTLANASEYIAVWIDYDNNGVLNQTSELLMSQGNTGVVTRTMVVQTPTSAAINTPLRMRVFDDAGTISSYCQTHYQGQTEDYTVRFFSSTLPPIANFFSNNRVLVVNSSTQFQDSSLNAPTSWNWTFQGGTPSVSAVQNPTVFYSAAGTYSVKLKVTNAFGTDSITKLAYITVNNSFTMCATTNTTNGGSGIIYDSGGPTGWYQNYENCQFLINPGCQGTVSITFSQFNTESCCDYLSVYNGSTTSSPLLGSYSGSSLPPTLNANSGKMLLRWSSDGSIVGNGFAATWTAAVTGTGTPVANFTMNTNPPLNTAVSFTDLTTNTPGQWLWQFDDGSISTIQHPVKTFTSSGVKSVTLTATNCSTLSSVIKTLTVQAAPGLSVSPATFSGNVNCGDSLVLPFTVLNTGAGALVTKAAMVNSYDSVRVLICTYGVNMTSTGDYQKVLSALSSYFTRYTVSTYTGNTSTGLATALNGNHVVIFPRQSSFSDTHYSSYGTTLNSFASAGGHVILLGTQVGTTRPFSTGLFSGSYSGMTGGFTFSITSSTDSLTYGLNTPTVSAPYQTNYFTVTNTDNVTLGEVAGYDVICYRNIGSGKVILIGSDFQGTNTSFNYVLARAVSQAKRGNNAYVTSQPPVLQPAQSSTANIVIRTAGLTAGVYTFTLQLTSNTVPPVTNIPVTFTVNGQPMAVVSPSCVGFGAIVQHTTKLDSITYDNTGCMTLSVSSISATNSAFSYSPSSSFTLAPWSSRKIYVSMSSSVIGTYNDVLQINSDGGNLSVCLNGTVASAPVAGVTPTSLSVVSPSCGATQTINLTVHNSGGTNLTFTVGGVSGNQQVQVLAIMNFVDLGTEYPNTISALNTYFSNYSVTTHSLTSVSAFQAALAGKHVILIPEQEGYSFGLMGSYSTAINSFVSAGGTAILLGSGTIQQINEIGLFNASYVSYSPSSMTVTDTSDIVMDFLPMGNLTPPNATFYGTFTNSGNTSYVVAGSYDVVLKRNIGLGKAYYLGFDYYGYSNQTARMLANAVRSGLAGVPWLSASSSTGVATPGSSTTITYTFNSTGLPVGTYTANLVIQTNDPLAPTITVPVSYSVSGSAVASVSPSCLNYGTIIQHTSKTDSVLLYNTGCAILNVTGMNSGSSAYTFSPSPSFTVAPAASRKIYVTFNPTVAGVFNHTLTITTNGGTVNVCLNGTAMGAPILSVTPNPFFVNSPVCNSQQTGTLSIFNPGGSNLTFNLGGTQGGQINVLAITNYADMFTEYPNTITALNTYFTNYSLTTHTITTVSGFSTALQGKHVLLIPEQEYYSWGFMQTYSVTINNFVNAGGTAILCGTGNSSQMNDIGLFPVSNVYSGNSIYVTDTNDAIMRGMPQTSILSPNATYDAVFAFTNYTAYVVTGFSSVVAKRKIGLGRAIYLGFDYYNYTNHSARMLANAVSSSLSFPPWLNPSATSGSVAASGSTQVTFTFNSQGMATGTYTYNLVITSNDPLVPSFTVPVTYSVYSGPGTSVTPTCLNFNTLVQYQSKTDSVTLTNIGCGTLTMTAMSNSNSAFSYSPAAGFTLASGASRKIYVTFKPMTGGSFTDTLKTFAAGGNQSVCLSGQALFAPVMSILPNAHTVTMTACYDAQTLGVVVQNTGGTPLTYSAPPGSGWLSGPSVATGTLGAGASATVVYGINTGSMSAGAYTIPVVFASDGPMTPTYTMPVVLHVSNNPCASFLFTNPDDCSGIVTFTNNVVNNANSFNWNFGNGGTSTLPHPIAAFTAPGNYTVSLTACNGTVCSSTTRTLHISTVGGPVTKVCAINASAPSASVGILNVKLNNTINRTSGYATEGFKDFSCTDQATLVAGVSYSMFITTGPYQAENVSVYIDYDNNGVFSGAELAQTSMNTVIAHTLAIIVPTSAVTNTPLRMRVIDDNAAYSITGACVALTNGQGEDYAVVIKPGNFAPQVNFSISANPCNGTIAFTDLSSYSPASWSWNFGDGGASVIQHPVHTYTAAGVYSVSLIAGNVYGNGFSVQTVTITNPGMAISASGTFKTNDSIAFAALPALPGIYTWNFGNGVASGAQAPVTTFTAKGFYTVELTVLSGTCINTVSLTIEIQEPVGLAEADASSYELFIYPNPFSLYTQVNIELNSPGHLKAEVVNSLGQFIRTVCDDDLSAGSHRYDINNVAAGLYYLRVTESGKVRSFKLISVY